MLLNLGLCIHIKKKCFIIQPSFYLSPLSNALTLASKLFFVDTEVVEALKMFSFCILYTHMCKSVAMCITREHDKIYIFNNAD